MNKIYSLLFLLVLTACGGDPDETFVDYFEGTTILPPRSLELASHYKSQPLRAWINNDGRIYGTGNGKRFYTDDFFFSTLYTATGFAAYDYIEIDGHHVQRTVYDDDANALTIETSDDFAEMFAPRATLTSIYSEQDFIFSPESAEKGWVAYSRGPNIEVYQIEGSSPELVAKIPVTSTAELLSVWIKDNEGIIAVERDEVTIDLYKTADGGTTWNFNSTVTIVKNSSNTPYQVGQFRVYGDFIYGGGYGHVYISRNNGATWELSNQKNLCSFQFLNASTGYALEMVEAVYNGDDTKLASTSYLYKTTDGGVTWNSVSDKMIYGDHLYFLNEDVGLAMSYSVLQMTRDGGTTWDLLVYPLKDE
jgi:hypothetical protein